MSDDRFKAVTLDDMTIPGGGSVNAGQTLLYTRVGVPAQRESAVTKRFVVEAV
jgi:hypothetical protein